MLALLLTFTYKALYLRDHYVAIGASNNYPPLLRRLAHEALGEIAVNVDP